MNTNQASGDTGSTARALSEPYAFAVLQWPALIGLLAIDGDGFGWLALRSALGVVAVLAALGAYSGGRGVGFGNAMLACGGCVVAAWWVWPTPWSLVWLAVLALLLLVAQNLRLRGAVNKDRSPVSAQRAT